MLKRFNWLISPHPTLYFYKLKQSRGETIVNTLFTGGLQLSLKSTKKKHLKIFYYFHRKLQEPAEITVGIWERRACSFRREIIRMISNHVELNDNTEGNSTSFSPTTN